MTLTTIALTTMDYQQGTVVVLATVDRPPTNLDVLTHYPYLKQAVPAMVAT
jgi:hypothetical protein